MLADLKFLLKITDDSNDGILNSVLLQSKMIIEKKLWYTLEKEDYIDHCCLDNSSILFLKAPIFSIEKIEWWAEIKSYTKNVLYLKKKIKWEVIVHYKWGFEQLPKVIQLATLNLAREIYKQETSDGLEIKSKKISSLSISYFTPEEMKKGSTALKETDLNALLAPYKLLHCYAV